MIVSLGRCLVILFFLMFHMVSVCGCAECLGGVQGDGAAVPASGPAADQHTLLRPGALADHRSVGHHHAGRRLDQRLPLPARK